MGDQHNERIVRELYERGVEGDYERFGEVIAPSYVLHPDEIRDTEGLREMIEGYKAGLSNLQVSIEHQFSAGDWVATRFTLTGRHDGDLLGLPASGAEVAVTGLAVSRCSDGRIEEEWELIDAPGLMAQIGAAGAASPA